MPFCHHGDSKKHTFITMSCIIAYQTRKASCDAKDDATMQSTSSGCDTCPRREECFSKRRIPRVLTTPPATQPKAHAFLKAVVRGDEHMREKDVTQPWPQRRAVATHHESVKTTAHQIRTQYTQLSPRTHARVQWSSCNLESSRGLAFDDDDSIVYTFLPKCMPLATELVIRTK